MHTKPQTFEEKAQEILASPDAFAKFTKGMSARQVARFRADPIAFFKERAARGSESMRLAAELGPTTTTGFRGRGSPRSTMPEPPAEGTPERADYDAQTARSKAVWKAAFDKALAKGRK